MLKPVGILVALLMTCSNAAAADTATPRPSAGERWKRGKGAPQI